MLPLCTPSLTFTWDACLQTHTPEPPLKTPGIRSSREGPAHLSVLNKHSGVLLPPPPPPPSAALPSVLSLQHAQLPWLLLFGGFPLPKTLPPAPPINQVRPSVTFPERPSVITEMTDPPSPSLYPTALVRSLLAPYRGLSLFPVYLLLGSPPTRTRASPGLGPLHAGCLAPGS